MWHGKGKHKNEKSMCKSEIFAEILKIVSQETEIAIDRILSSDKDSETVDARYLLVHILSEKVFILLKHLFICIKPRELLTISYPIFRSA